MRINKLTHHKLVFHWFAGLYPNKSGCKITKRVFWRIHWTIKHEDSDLFLKQLRDKSEQIVHVNTGIRDIHFLFFRKAHRVATLIYF